MASAIPDFDSLWNYSDPSGTEEKFVELRPAVEGSRVREAVVQLETQIARARGLQRKFDAASELLDSIKKEALTLPVAEVRYLLERGRVLNSSGHGAEALPHFKEAFQKARERGLDNFAVDAAHMVAIAEPQAADQTAWNKKAMELAEGSKDPKARAWLASLYNNMGWTEHDAGNFGGALQLFEKALKEREKKGDAQTIRIGKWSVARALRSLKRMDDALSIQLALEKENAAKPDGFVYEELAEIYAAKGVKVDAQKYAKLALAELSKDSWFLEKEKKRIERLKALAE